MDPHRPQPKPRLDRSYGLAHPSTPKITLSDFPTQILLFANFRPYSEKAKPLIWDLELFIWQPAKEPQRKKAVVLYKFTIGSRINTEPNMIRKVEVLEFSLRIIAFAESREIGGFCAA